MAFGWERSDGVVWPRGLLHDDSVVLVDKTSKNHPLRG